ncbi:hypothetical protein O7627_09770 [Solwaraspora sp. WMMD1047]|uniref:hypothetical protein n=1 Tax=Solwaraspora sp. WMMD1047 TaxID=3016102 RepID=UPI0024172F23|nr:hypothetical protein [Solwaraspora sp. WMMD1047]MDG4829589.1 hypothetical protein [Solwaraspora sp. WMMD1047]
MSDTTRLKVHGEAENEVHDPSSFTDLGRCVVTPIAIFPEETALGVVSTLSSVVSQGHARQENHRRDSDGIVRAQVFEEGDVFMTAAPFDGFSADRYLMDFYDVQERDICSRMHFHTGMRFVRMMTGPDTQIRVSALSPLRVAKAPGGSMALHQFEDEHPRSDPAQPATTRYNLVVPPCAWVDMQIPRGTAHQFNAMGPNAVIDTIHPEESIEIFRERIGKINMMAQTVFLEQEQPPSESCVIPGLARA